MGEFEKSCVNCGVLNCAKRDKEYPEFCLTTNFDVKELEEIKKLYLEDEENNKVSVISAEIEAEFYCRYTRVEEIIEFSKRMGFHKIGIATCIGLIEESRIFAQILKKNGPNAAVWRQLSSVRRLIRKNPFGWKPLPEPEKPKCFPTACCACC